MNSQFIKILLALVCLQTPHHSFAGIDAHCSKWSCVSSILQSAKPKASLVIIGVDDVILEFSDSILKSAHKAYKSKLMQNIKRHGIQKSEEILSIQIRDAQKILIDPEVKILLQELHKRGVDTICISHGWSGPYGKIKSLEHLKVNKLSNLGIDLSWSSIYSHDILILDNYELDDLQRLPSFFRGVLFTSHISSGDAIDSLFQKLNFYPKEIFYVDSLNKYINSVKFVSQTRGISFRGIIYDRITKNITKTPLDINIADLQFHHLMTKKQWLDDDSARKMIYRN